MRIARLNAWDEGIVDTFVHTSLQSIAPSKLTVGRAALSHQCARVDAVTPRSGTAEERYREFLRVYPSIALRVPQTMLASYLGMTPETVSRIRKALSRR